MHKKIIIIFFSVILFFLFSVFIVRTFFYKPKDQKTSSTVVIPQINKKGDTAVVDSSTYVEENTMVSLIPLNDDETLFGVVSMDFDGDGFDDQINAIKTSSSPYISLIIGLYNPKKSVYERMGFISTEINQVRTFSYTGIDLTGEHKISLVYQGYADNGDSLLQAFFIERKGLKFNLRKIADFRGDGTIFIQQTDRYDAYERSNAKGASFPIWVYTSDVSKPNSTDQLQIKYDWNDDEKSYVQVQQIRVAGSRLAAKELARIQDGTVATFAKFLNGLWYKIDNTGKVRHYLFFDYESNEIIFFDENIQEVYKWVHSTIRRNGIYISSINQEIQNLQRRVNVSLLNVDEIRIRLQDDVRMLISESNIWNGDYKKLSSVPNVEKKTNNSSNSTDFLKILEEGVFWKNSEGNKIKFEDGNFTLEIDDKVETGVYAKLTLDDKFFIQFRSQNKTSNFNGVFLVSFTASSNNSKKINKDSLILQAYKVQPDGYFSLEKRPVILTKLEE